MTDLAYLPRYDANPETLRRVLSYFPTGVVALIADVGGEPQGMVASSFATGISWQPPLVSCAIQQSSSTWPALRSEDRIGVSVLAADHARTARQIASRDRAGRFVDVPLRHVGSSARFIAGAPVWFECSVYSTVDAGDHLLVLFEIIGLGADPELEPLVSHGPDFRTLLAPEKRPA